MRAMAFAPALLFTCGPAFAQTPIRTTPEACAQLRSCRCGRRPHRRQGGVVEAGAPMPGGRAGAPPVATHLPAYCRLDGVIDRRTGAAGATYGIGFALALAGELEWPFPVSGRRRPERLGAAAARRVRRRRHVRARPRVRGRQHRHRAPGRGGFDATFMQDQQASLDFAYAAVGRVAERRQADHRPALRHAAGPVRTSPAVPPAAARRC